MTGICINQDEHAARIDAPQDAELIRLSRELNATYIRYGAKGDAGAANQVAQDTNSVSASQNVAAGRIWRPSRRNATKFSGKFRN